MNIESEIKLIQERNRRVEVDKSWEMSFVRRFFIACATYILAVLWLLAIENTKPFLNAIIPAGGYFVSTLTLPLLKSWWTRSK